jgi:hypothetical protein
MSRTMVKYFGRVNELKLQRRTRLQHQVRNLQSHDSFATGEKSIYVSLSQAEVPPSTIQVTNYRLISSVAARSPCSRRPHPAGEPHHSARQSRLGSAASLTPRLTQPRFHRGSLVTRNSLTTDLRYNFRGLGRLLFHGKTTVITNFQTNLKFR